MKRIIKYNFQIFLTWLVFIVFKKPMSQEGMELIEKNYNAKDREKRLLARIKKINNIK